MNKVDIAERIEQFMFERGEYDFPETEQIRWLKSSDSFSEGVEKDKEDSGLSVRDNTVNNIVCSLKSNTEPLKNYLDSQIAEMDDEDELISVANQLLQDIDGCLELVPIEDDIFFLYEDGRCHWYYYNPDSNSEGQIVLNIFQSGDILDAALKASLPEDFFDYLGSVSKQELIDKGTEDYDSFLKLSEIPDLVGCTEETMKQLIDWAD